MRHLRKISDYAIIGSLGALIAVGLQGCDNNSSSKSEPLSQIKEKQGALVIIEEQPQGGYKILEEYPSETTRIVLKDPSGKERILTQEEVDRLIQEEAAKIEQGTSQLTNPGGMGLSLGETILASMAGAMLGSWIGSKLFNNPNYQAQQRATYKSPQAYERSQNSFKSSSSATAPRGTSTGASSTPSSAKGGYFGSSSSPSSTPSSPSSSSSSPSYGG